jgi:hypothetical protein
VVTYYRLRRHLRHLRHLAHYWVIGSVRLHVVCPILGHDLTFHRGSGEWICARCRGTLVGWD